MAQSTFAKTVMSKASDSAGPLACAATWVTSAGPGHRLAAAMAVMISALCLIAIKTVFEYARVNGRPLTPAPIEDHSDSLLVQVSKYLLQAFAQSTAFLLPMAVYFQLSGEPWKGLPDVIFVLFLLLSAAPAMAWLRYANDLRRQKAQSRRAGVVTE